MARSGDETAAAIFRLIGGVLAAAVAAAALSVAPAAAGPGQGLEADAVRARSPVVPVAVFGADERTNVPARLERVSERLGLLFNNRLRTVCSAFCVAENMIVTAAHCIARGQANASTRYSDFVFARNYDKVRDFSRFEGSSGVSAAQYIAAGDFKLRVRPPIDAVFDWAVVRLQRNGCPAGGLAVRSLSSTELVEAAQAGRIFQVSYHRDWAQWRPAYSKPCSIARDFDAAKWQAISPDFVNAEQMILHTCDTGGASSGSPILLDAPEGPVVVGLNVGTYVQSKIVTQNGQVTLRQRSETIANTAVSAQVFAGLIEPLRQAAILPTGNPMRELQELLRARNHYSGRIDQTYGPGLKSAIEAYEQASRLPVTGLATQALLNRLMRETQAAARSGEQTPSSSSQPPR